jgi:hypothetical protein
MFNQYPRFYGKTTSNIEISGNFYYYFTCDHLLRYWYPQWYTVALPAVTHTKMQASQSVLRLCQAKQVRLYFLTLQHDQKPIKKKGTNLNVWVSNSHMTNEESWNQ